MDYRCPACESKLFKAAGQVPVRVEIKCGSCGEIVEPDATSPVLHRTYRCENDDCGRIMHVERPTHERSYCAVCGTPSLEVVKEQRSGYSGRKETGRVAFAGVNRRD